MKSKLAAGAFCVLLVGFFVARNSSSQRRVETNVAKAELKTRSSVSIRHQSMDSSQRSAVVPPTVFVPVAALQVVDRPTGFSLQNMDPGRAAVRLIELWSVVMTMSPEKAGSTWSSIATTAIREREARFAYEQVLDWTKLRTSNGTVRNVALAVKVHDAQAGSDTRVVDVWDMTVVSVTGGAAKAGFFTTTFVLRPDGDSWQLAGRSEVLGPAPKLGNQPTVGGGQLDASLNGFDPVTTDWSK
jgi:hypothetical protein